MVPYIITGGNDWDTGIFFSNFVWRALPKELLSDDEYEEVSEGVHGISREAEEFLDNMDKKEKREIAIDVARDLFEYDIDSSLPLDVDAEISDVYLYERSTAPFIQVTLDDESYAAMNKFCEENGFSTEWVNDVIRRSRRRWAGAEDEWKFLFTMWEGAVKL